MKVNAVIFDLDGTLTEPVLDFDTIRSEMGLPPESVDILTAMEAMAPARQKQAHSILARHEHHAAQNSQLNDGVTELLAELRRRKIPIGLLTRNTRENTLHAARRHQLRFDAIVDRQDGPVKPDAYGVLEICRRFNATPAETVIVGDFLHDLQSARNAGAIAVLIKTHPKADHYKAHADYSISHMSELLGIINKIEAGVKL
ncbi:MAG: HAD family hydrolase [Planctomycetes bacterium]|nr:HAD family hydrolase [Planctomycetota bacterium]